MVADRSRQVGARRRKSFDPLEKIPSGAWVRLQELTDTPVGFLRKNLTIYLTALHSLGLELTDKASASEVDWDRVATAIGDVLGDVASDRDMGVMVSSDREVDLVVAAVRKEVEGREG